MKPTDTIRESYDRNAPHYDRHAALEKEVGSRLLDRITFRRDEPAVVLDLGCGTAAGAAALKNAFRKALVVGLDLSPGMLREAGQRSRMTRRLRLLNADMAALPLRRHSADLVYSNLALPWLDDPERFFSEVVRVLRPGGMFLFSAYGVGSLAGLEGTGSDRFPDVLQLGDALTAAGFREPVMDVDRITLQYPDVTALAGELEVTGTALLVDGWGEAGHAEKALAAALAGGEGKIPLGFEILYGMAFGPPEGQPRRTDDGEIATFSVDSLLKSRNLGYD